MFRRFVSMRGLCQVMTGIDLSMSSKRAMTLDALFAKYSQSRKEHVWAPRCDKAWAPKEGIPQEFVGFLLIRQYPSVRGRVRNSMLNGADADLLAAVASEFGVPLEHIECRVVYFYVEGQVSASNVHADFVKGVDGMKKPRKGDTPVKGLRWDDGGRQYDLMYGREYRRVAIVGGSRQCDAEEVGHFHGNEAETPIYRYRDTYLYFHVKYLEGLLDASGGIGWTRLWRAGCTRRKRGCTPAQTKDVVALQKYLHGITPLTMRRNF